VRSSTPFDPPTAASPSAGAADPRHQRAVVEADDQLHAHRDAPLTAFDDADHLGHAWRHAVHHGGDACLRLELGLEHERVAAVRTSHAPDLARRGQTPATVVGGTQQRGEAGGRVETGQAEPVDRAVAADQGGGLAVTDERVVLDRQGRHGTGGRTPFRRSAWA
jgi:hypothetical protein